MQEKIDIARTNRINTLFREIEIQSSVLDEPKNDNLFLDCHFGSNIGMIAGSSDFLIDLDSIVKFRNFTIALKILLTSFIKNLPRLIMYIYLNYLTHIGRIRVRVIKKI